MSDHLDDLIQKVLADEERARTSGLYVCKECGKVDTHFIEFYMGTLPLATRGIVRETGLCWKCHTKKVHEHV